jgi:aminoglycoside 2'-N-acetyltransferase I
MRLRRLATEELTAAEVAAIRDLLWVAFVADEVGFSEDDWRHAVGGVHFVLDVDGEIAAHAAVVERQIYAAGRPLRAGYVEAVATAADRQGMGLGTQVMEDVGSYLRERFELGVLGTGSFHFYERLGWRRWAGPSSVRTGDGLQPTPDDDGYILYLPTPGTPAIDPDGPISCDWRPGDVW